jgi:hypothetical protein
MKFLKFLFVFCLIILPFGYPLFSQISSESNIYRVVNVKGNPLRSGKETLKDGQKIEGKEKVMFTTMKDAVVLLNASFDKIYLKPKGPVQLKKLLKVGDFAQGKIYGTGSTKNAIMNLRGGMSGTEFQSISDTLKLHIVKDLKRTPDASLSSFKLFDQYMESIQGVMKVEGEYLIIMPKKSGFYNLHFSKGTSASEVLAEIEFLDMDELKSELKFVASAAVHIDSAKSNQIRYIKKLYPKVIDNQISEILAKK